MLRELNENEMKTVSGGSAFPSDSPYYQLQGDSDYLDGGADGTIAVDTGGLSDGTGTGVLMGTSPSGIADFSPTNISGAFFVGTGIFGANAHKIYLMNDGSFFADMNRNNSIDALVQRVQGGTRGPYKYSLLGRYGW